MQTCSLPVCLMLLTSACGARTNDVADPDADSDPEANAPDGGVDADVAQACVDGQEERPDSCADVCAWCPVRQCFDGQWIEGEDAPLARCCDPIAQGCPPAEACYFDELSAGFLCMQEGSIDWEGTCTAANDCAKGMTCLDTPWGARECRTLCDPNAFDADSACGGQCTSMSDWSYPPHDVGVCIFLGG